MSIHYLPSQFTLPERHKMLTPVRVSIAGYVKFDRELVKSLQELERAYPAPARLATRDSFTR